jgi:hypothetical protein
MRLYRFIDLNRGWVEGAADGPWWLEPAQFRTLRAFAQWSRRPLAECARRLVAVRDEFSKVDAVVSARVGEKPLVAWRGVARIADEGDVSSANADPEGGRADQGSFPPIVQIFIPGLGRPYQKFSAFMRLEGAARLGEDLRSTAGW